MRKQCLTAFCLQIHTKILPRDVHSRIPLEENTITAEEGYVIMGKSLTQEKQNSHFVARDRVDAPRTLLGEIQCKCIVLE